MDGLILIACIGVLWLCYSCMNRTPARRTYQIYELAEPLVFSFGKVSPVKIESWFMTEKLYLHTKAEVQVLANNDEEITLTFRRQNPTVTTLTP